MNRYKIGDKYLTKKGRTYFFILNPGSPDYKFVEAIDTIGNSLINSAGGIIVCGVDEEGYVRGFKLNRLLEDSYKCAFDKACRQFKPTVHPHQYRMDVLNLNHDKAIFEIRFSAGDPAEIYENFKKEMFIVKDKGLYGPLIPCEIAQIVLEKYKQEITGLLESKKPTSPRDENTQLPSTSSKESSVIIIEDSDCDEKKAKRLRITWP